MKKKCVKRPSKGGCPKNIKMAEVIVPPISHECVMKMAKEMDGVLEDMKASGEWIPMACKWPPVCRDILFTDG
jgi:hypothetical protein